MKEFGEGRTMNTINCIEHFEYMYVSGERVFSLSQIPKGIYNLSQIAKNTLIVGGAGSPA